MEVTITHVTTSVSTIDGGGLNPSVIGQILAGVLRALEDKRHRDDQHDHDR